MEALQLGTPSLDCNSAGTLPSSAGGLEHASPPAQWTSLLHTDQQVALVRGQSIEITTRVLPEPLALPSFLEPEASLDSKKLCGWMVPRAHCLVCRR